MKKLKTEVKKGVALGSQLLKNVLHSLLRIRQESSLKVAQGFVALVFNFSPLSWCPALLE